MKYKWLLLDIDNTLLDFTSAAHRALQNSLLDNKIELTPELHTIYKDVNHKTWVEFEQGIITAVRLRSLRFERFFESAHINNIDPETFSQSFLSQLVHESTAYDGIISILLELQKKYTLSIITNGLKEVQRPRLKRLNMTQLFDSIVVSDEIGYAKPDKRFFDYTMNSINHNYYKSDILVVGDNLQSDIIGGNNYGLDTCWIAHDRDNTSEIKSTHTIDSFLEIRSILG